MTVVIIPMMGKSTRFAKAGFDVAKYRLTLHGESVFSLAVRSFATLFDKEPILFVVPRGDAREFVASEARRLGIAETVFVELDGDTRGQADSVYQGLRRSGLHGSLYIFNIDTFRLRFSGFEAKGAAGLLDVFVAGGDGWSFVDPGPDKTVRRTTEKDRVSHLCSTGLYWFEEDGIFVESFEEMERRDERTRGEFYVAPLYNSLLRKGLTVRYSVAPAADVVSCGTPDEYLALSRSYRFAETVRALGGRT